MRVLVDQRINENALSSLKSLGFEPILMPPSPLLQSGVSSHTDMLIFIGFGGIFCHASYYEANKALIDEIAENRLEIKVSNEQMSAEYPHDVLFNACILGSRLICNTKTASRLILDAAEENGYEIIHVPQGYTKCSICPIDGNAAITSDIAISKTLTCLGVDVLTVSEGHISLPPYNYGFIGGASGCYIDKVFFCGSLSTHPDGKRISEFCQKHCKDAFDLSDQTLQDVGSLFFI